MCIYCDYCVYHYKSTELVSLYTLDIGPLNKYYYYYFGNLTSEVFDNDTMGFLVLVVTELEEEELLRYEGIHEHHN